MHKASHETIKPATNKNNFFLLRMTAAGSHDPDRPYNQIQAIAVCAFDEASEPEEMQCSRHHARSTLEWHQEKALHRHMHY